MTASRRRATSASATIEGAEERTIREEDPARRCDRRRSAPRSRRRRRVLSRQRYLVVRGRRRRRRRGRRRDLRPGSDRILLRRPSGNGGRRHLQGGCPHLQARRERLRSLHRAGGAARREVRHARGRGLRWLLPERVSRLLRAERDRGLLLGSAGHEVGRDLQARHEGVQCARHRLRRLHGRGAAGDRELRDSCRRRL